MESIVGDRLRDKDFADKGDLGDLEEDFFEGGEADDGNTVNPGDDGNTANPTANCSMMESMGTVGGDEQMRPEFPCTSRITIRESSEGHLQDMMIRMSPALTGHFTDASTVGNPETSPQEIVRLSEISQSKRVHE